MMMILQSSITKINFQYSDNTCDITNITYYTRQPLLPNSEPDIPRAKDQRIMILPNKYYLSLRGICIFYYLAQQCI